MLVLLAGGMYKVRRWDDSGTTIYTQGFTKMDSGVLNFIGEEIELTRTEQG